MPTARPSTPRSMSAHHVRWYTALRSPSTAVAINASMRVVGRPAFQGFNLAPGGVAARSPASGGVAGLCADGSYAAVLRGPDAEISVHRWSWSGRWLLTQGKHRAPTKRLGNRLAIANRSAHRISDA